MKDTNKAVAESEASGTSAAIAGGGTDFRRLARRNYWKAHWPLYAFVAPTVIFMLVFCYYPMLGIQLAFKNWNPNLGIWGSHIAQTKEGTVDAFLHFKKFFEPEILEKLKNTVRLSTLRLLIGFPLPIVMVVFMNEMRVPHTKKLIQTLTYLPHFVSWVIIAGILKNFVATGSGFQEFCKAVFGKELLLFSNSDLFIVTLLVSDVWKEVGWSTIIYLAAIAGIDPSLEEAAMIDGANRRQKICHIILPGIMPAVSINMIFACSGILNGGFDQVFNMYNSAVYSKGDILETYLYRIGVSGGDYSLSTALGLLTSLVSVTLMLIANKIVEKLGGTHIL